MAASTAMIMGGGMAAGGLLNYLGAKEQQQGMNRAIDKMSNVQNYTQFGDKTPEQQMLEQQSIAQYQQQQQLVDQMMGDFGARQGLQNNARDTIGSILSGQSFDVTPEERARIDAIRNADIAYGTNEVQGLLDQRLSQLQSDTARRGVRGQAYSQLQGGALDTAADALNQRILGANQNAANMAVQMPASRVGLQGNMANQYADFGTSLQQQAFANRQALQNPAMMQQLFNQRINEGVSQGPAAGYGQALMQQGMQYSPGLQGIQGLMGGATSGMNMASGMQKLGMLGGQTSAPVVPPKPGMGVP